MDFPHFVVLLIILFSSISLCMLADYMLVDRREIRRKAQLADVAQFPTSREQKRAA